MKYNPEDATRLIKEGETNITVSDSIDYISKTSGNESIKMTLQSWDSDGKEGTIISYLSAAWQIKAVCLCLGVPVEEFNTGEMTAERFKGLSGKIINKIEKSENPKYEDKNIVAKWIKKEVGTAQSSAETPFNDDIPF